jgi:uncharacterized protein YdgA (DUF945 family)
MQAKKIVLAIGLLAAAYVGATAWSGHRVQQELQAQTAAWQAAPQGPLALVDSRYEKSLLGATRTSTLRIGCGDKALKLSWQDQIQHGPLPGFSGLGAARIRSELLLDDAQKAALKQFTGSDRLDLQINTLVGFGGQRHLQVALPALQMQTPAVGEGEAQQAAATWQLKDLKADVNIAADGSATYKAGMAEYRVDAGKVQMLMAGMQFDGEGLAPLWWLFSGKGSGRIETLSVGEAGGKPVFLLKGTTFSQQAQMQNGLYSASVQMQGSGEAGGEALSPVAMKFSMKNIHAETYKQFLMQALQTDCKPEAADPQAQMAAMMAPLKAMLAHNPAFSLDELRVGWGGQTAELGYSVASAGITPADLENPNPMALMGKLKLDARVKAPQSMLMKLMQQGATPQPPEVAEQGIERLVAQGLLRRDGDLLSGEASFAQGALTVNGKAIPLPGQAPPVEADMAPPAPEALPRP